MMKVGILTWYFALNHGARAHTYALVNLIRQMGHDAEVINYQSPKIFWYVKRRWIYSKNPYKVLKRYQYLKYFENTVDVYEKNSVFVNSPKEIDNLEYDLIILGSDEIFNVFHPITSIDYTYFGLGIKKTPKITYAVSAGQTPNNIVWENIIREALGDVKAFSARDKNTKYIIENNIGKECEVVLDPTFLWDFSHCYDKNWLYDEYLLIYSFNGVERYKENIISYARDNSYKIVYISGKVRWADVSIQCPTQEQWYAAFKFAKLVITDSYHGTIFSIKNEVPFAISIMDDKIIKISNLLDSLGIKFENFVLDYFSIDEIINRIDYALISKNVEIEKEKSISWLSNALCKYE